MCRFYYLASSRMACGRYDADVAAAVASALSKTRSEAAAIAYAEAAALGAKADAHRTAKKVTRHIASCAPPCRALLSKKTQTASGGGFTLSVSPRRPLAVFALFTHLYHMEKHGDSMGN
jgi:hypothetical protein